MGRFKIIVLLATTLLVPYTFNACSEASFSSLNADGSNKVIAVADENIDESEEVAEIEEEYGVTDPVVPVEEDDDNEVEDDDDNEYADHPGKRDDDHDDDDNDDDDKKNDKDSNKGDKVKICHVPPGNPEAKHTIVVGWAAVRAHVDRNHNHEDAEHKDYFGDCRDGDVDYVVDDDDDVDGDDVDGDDADDVVDGDDGDVVSNGDV